jgi:hypothetical protein
MEVECGVSALQIQTEAEPEDSSESCLCLSHNSPRSDTTCSSCVRSEDEPNQEVWMRDGIR